MKASGFPKQIKGGAPEECGEEVSTILFFGKQEDLRIGREEVWRFGGLVREITLHLHALSHKGSGDYIRES